MNWRKKISLAREMARRNPELQRTAIAREFGIARSTLYKKNPKQAEKDRLLLQKVLEVFGEHPHYGHRRIALLLNRNKNTILRIVRKYGLRRKRYRKKPRYAKNRSISAIPNRIKRLCPVCPNVIWVGDFTYLSYYGTFIYLATVIDLFTKEIVGWSVKLTHGSDLVIEALEDARRRRLDTPHTFHSDRGSEYDSVATHAWMIAHTVLPSQSAKAHPWENGTQEAFFRVLKQEFGDPSSYHSLDDLLEAIHHYIHYYNTKRIHGVLKMTPGQFHQKFHQEEMMRRFPIEKMPFNPLSTGVYRN